MLQRPSGGNYTSKTKFANIVFYDTLLGAILKILNDPTVIICGIPTNYGCRTIGTRTKTESYGLGLFLRSLVGLDREAAKRAFETRRLSGHRN